MSENEDKTKLKITENGIEIPDIETIYNAILDEWNTVFGGQLRTENRLSPQGQLALSLAKQIDEKNKNLLLFINQFNINTAKSNFLDYLYNNFGIYRNKGSKSIVTCQCVLEKDTQILMGDEAANENNDIFISTENYTAGEEERTFDIVFEAEETGDIPCDSNTLTTIETVKDGWVSVNNKEAGTVGDENTKSTVTCQCILKLGTTINIGDKIKNTNNDVFVSTQEVSYNNIIKDIVFASKEIGAIECKAGTINKIITDKPGWISINNSNDGTIGSIEENDDQFRIRAMNSHMINALGTDRALKSKLLELSGVSDVYIYDNRKKENEVIDEITITPNSCYLAIRYDGEANTKQEIANIMHLTCSACTYIGDTQIDIPIENAPNNEVDSIFFQTATPQQVYLKISIQRLVNYTEDTDFKIKKIVLDNFNGNVENIQKCGIGSTIYANRFFENLVYLEGTEEAIIKTITISKDNTSFIDNIKIPITKYPILQNDNIIIEVNN